MITSLLLSLIFGFVWAITTPLRILPDVVLSSSLTSAIQTANQYIAPINTVAPLTDLLAIFALVLAIESSIFLYKVIMWIIKRIPTQS